MIVEYGEWRGCKVAFADGALYIERKDKPNLVGGIARGKVDRIVGKAAFVKLPNNAMGYLEKAKGAKPGDELLVQVSTYATEGKAWPISTELKLQSRAYIYLPQGKGIAVSKKLTVGDAARLTEDLAQFDLPGGWIIRSTALEAPNNSDIAQTLVARAQQLDSKIAGWLIAPLSVVDRAALETSNSTLQALDADDMDEVMRPLTALDIALQSGSRLRLGLTPALCAIDVDAGSTNPADLGQQAADAIFAAIRNRALAGQIVIDPLRGDKSLLATLKKSLPADITFYGQTKMGLIELSRPRYGPSLYEALDD